MKLRFSQILRLALSGTAAVGMLALFFALKTPRIVSALAPDAAYNREAMFWSRADLGVKCGLCPNNCFLPDGFSGKCRTRANWNNTLWTKVFGRAASINIDPIEKKPVFHMLPGSSILSLATVGCPLQCSFCQNWSLSQAYPEETENVPFTSPEAIVSAALQRHIPSIAYTYSEPVAFYEYMLETAKLAKARGLRNVMVTSGYINQEPLKKLAPYFDVIKVDLKGMSEEFYDKEVGGSLADVLETLKTLKKMNVLTEVVNLVVPRRNDSPEDFLYLSRWVKENMGPDCPLFFSRFHPDYRLRNLPPTPVETLEQARDIAMKEGLRYVYLGNVPGHAAESTYCPYDGTILVKRSGYYIEQNNLRHGRCPKCGRKIPGVWE